MGKWSKIRVLLKSVAAASAVAAGISAALGALPLAGIFGLIATHAGVVVAELPRDPWSAEKRAEKLGKKAIQDFKDEEPTPGLGHRKPKP